VTEKKQGIQVIKPSLPKGGGAIKGMAQSFAADDFMGSASLSIPLPVSPCRGFEPQLALAYNSRGGRSVFGHGFSLSLPSVSRLTSLGMPKYTLEDTFVLSGQDFLVPKLDQSSQPNVTTKTIGSNTYQVTHFIPRVDEQYDLIAYYINLHDSGDQYWQVTHTDNTVDIYGKSSSAKIFDPQDPSRIYEWLLEESFDDKGDHIIYVYQKENSDDLIEQVLNNHCGNDRDTQTNTYISYVKYGNDKAIIDGALVTGKSSTALNSVDWHFEIVFDYGQYDIDVNNQDIHNIPAGKQWACRQDPFSQYDAGFEIRTLRQCQNILLFHCFSEVHKGVPVLNKCLALTYDTSTPVAPYVSLLLCVTESGYYFNEAASAAPFYQSISLPPLSLGFTPFLPFTVQYQPAAFESCLLNDDKAHSPVPDITSYQIVDLYSEGVPGLLYADGQSVFYRQAEKVSDNNVQYGPANAIDFPINRTTQDAVHTLVDTNGNGKLDLMVSAPQCAGYYALTGNKNQLNPQAIQWQNFQPFAAFPLDFHAPTVELTDVTGDGLADVIQIQQRAVRINSNQGNAGYGQTVLAERLHDVPSSKVNAAIEMLTFANMLGAGSPQRVRITNGMVECWPNLGYGKFGKKVVLHNAPYFGDDFTTERLLLTDIDGSGVSDIAYIYPDRVDIYINQSGNGFSSTPVSVKLPATYSTLDQIQFSDIKGNGTACLVFRKAQSVAVQSQSEQWFFDFNQLNNMSEKTAAKPQVPFLLQSISNNMGASTTLCYTSSSEFYLADKAKGIPWVTTQASAINVLSSVTHNDAISQTSTTESYQYHHGYFDGVEREFRGFGCVEKTNAANFSDFLPSDTEQAAAYNTPTTHTKTWYHTGACLEQQALLQQYHKEYWAGDSEACDFPATEFTFKNDSTANTVDTIENEAVREGHRALYGKVLRSEIYAKDASPWQYIPYTVSETQYNVPQLQFKGNNTYAVFRVDERQSLNYHYERNAQDPKVSHNFILARDSYGHILQSCEVSYGRRKSQLPASMNKQTQAQQSQLGVIYEDHEWINSPDITPAPSFYYSGVPKENKSYELTGIFPSKSGYFNVDDLQQQIKGILENTKGDNAQALLHDWVRHYYFDAITQKEQALGVITAPLLHHRSESIAFDIKQTESKGFSYLASGELAQLLTGDGTNSHSAKGGYIIPISGGNDGTIEETNYYWNPGSAQAYFNHDNFYLASNFYDPFQYLSIYYGASTLPNNSIPTTCYTYDAYHLMVTSIIDPLSNQSTLSHIDYQHLHPQTSTDPNGNSSSVLLDALGMVIATSSSGTQVNDQGEIETLGFASLKNYQVQLRPKLADIVNNPEQYLQNTASFFYYDFESWKKNKTPAYAVEIYYDNYMLVNGKVVSATPNIQKHLSYSDGFGRVLQSKAYYDGNEPKSHNTWLTSGAMLYDNKSQPIKQYEPFFAPDYTFSNEQAMKQVGQSSTKFYDGLGREVMVLSPDGFITKTLMGNIQASTTLTYTGWLNRKLYSSVTNFQPSLWSSLHFDANDSIDDSVYTVPEKNVDITTATLELVKSTCANTPIQSTMGSFAHVVETRQLNVPVNEEDAQYDTYNVWGNELRSADTRLHGQGLSNFTTSYNQHDVATVIDSADGGKRWVLHDVVGNVIYYKDARATKIYKSYDVLHRHQQTFVSNSSKDMPLSNTVKKTWYGDSVDSSGTDIFTDAKKYNLLGLPVISLDEAGLSIIPVCDVLGHPQYRAQWIKEGYKSEADWKGINTDVITSLASTLENIKTPITVGSITLPKNLSTLLLTEAYTTRKKYDALGRVTSATDAAGNQQLPAYYSTNWLKSLSLVAGTQASAAAKEGGVSTGKTTLISGIHYNALGLRTDIAFNNNVSTSYHYDPYSFHLMGIKSQRAKSSSVTACNLQCLQYQHDPMGNISRCSNDAIPVINKGKPFTYFNNQKVKAEATYSYDRMYRLTTATGREQATCQINNETNQNKFTGACIQANNGQALQNYSQTFTYDAGNNLIGINHSSASKVPARKNSIQTTSNQLKSSTYGSNSTNYNFDKNGNMLTLDGTAGVCWNYRDNMASATNIVRDNALQNDTNSDTEYYVYDGSGNRVRKVMETTAKGVTTLHEVLYVGDIEIRQQGVIKNNQTTINDIWHVVRLMDGDSCFCVFRYWVKGKIKTGSKSYQLRYQLNDLLDSSCLEVDCRGQVITYEEYYPYGGTSVSVGRTQTEVKNKCYRYSGKELDATGLYYYGMRYYAPWLGRWTCVDPAGTVDGLNIYRFVRGNPVRYVDVGGMGAEEIWKKMTQISPSDKSIEMHHLLFHFDKHIEESKKVVKAHLSKKVKEKGKLHIMIISDGASAANEKGTTIAPIYAEIIKNIKEEGKGIDISLTVTDFRDGDTKQGEIIDEWGTYHLDLTKDIGPGSLPKQDLILMRKGVCPCFEHMCAIPIKKGETEETVKDERLQGEGSALLGIRGLLKPNGSAYLSGGIEFPDAIERTNSRWSSLRKKITIMLRHHGIMNGIKPTPTEVNVTDLVRIKDDKSTMWGGIEIHKSGKVK